MNQQQETQFRYFLLEATAQAKKLGYRPNEFEKMIERDGPFATVKRIVPRKDPSEGFYRLHQLGHIDLTCEAIIVETSWRSFFDADLLAIAEKRLTAFKYAWKPYVDEPPEHPDKTTSHNATTFPAQSPESTDDEFVPPEMDHREREMRMAYLRPGQSKFRDSLVQRYGSRCCITGCTVVEALEAAHIAAYRGEGFNHVQNGLLMRADLHKLFDRYMFSVEPTELRVVLSEKLKVNEFYSALADVRLDIHSASTVPSKKAIDLHWQTFIADSKA